MRHPIIRIALIATAAIAIAGCKRSPTVNNITSNDLDANMTMGAPANDASAMESATNSVQPMAPANTSNSASNGAMDSPPPPSTNNVESNTVGM